MIDNFINIGFKFKESKETSMGVINEYNYYPDYLGENHYTLITFRSHFLSQDTDYRLYIHNSNSEFVDSPFQLSDRGSDLERRFKEVFKGELKKLNREYQFNLIFS